MRALTIAAWLGLAMAGAGCNDDCSGQSIFHCPEAEDLVCRDGRWACIPNDMHFAESSADLATAPPSD